MNHCNLHNNKYIRFTGVVCTNVKAFKAAAAITLILSATILSFSPRIRSITSLSMQEAFLIPYICKFMFSQHAFIVNPYSFGTFTHKDTNFCHFLFRGRTNGLCVLIFEYMSTKLMVTISVKLCNLSHILFKLFLVISYIKNIIKY